MTDDPRVEAARQAFVGSVMWQGEESDDGQYDLDTALADALAAADKAAMIHDAAPDDATQALVELVGELRVYRRAREQRNIELGAQQIERVMNVLDRLRATPKGAALIRQAEERDDG